MMYSGKLLLLLCMIHSTKKLQKGRNFYGHINTYAQNL